jgi:ligand-binding SRPBCC domain-containing protein
MTIRAAMALIELQTFISAPPERCFDLSLSVDLHIDSTASTRERAIDGVTSGVMLLDNTVTWEARHLGWCHRMSVRITGYDRPRWFRDEMIAGPFRRMRHDHWFDAENDRTTMRDSFEFSTRLPLLDALVLAPHLRRFLIARNEFIRDVAESDDWRRFLGDRDP